MSRIVDDLLRQGRLEPVVADPDAAQMIVDEAKRHLESAERILDTDANGAYQLLYDAARKAVSAHMLRAGYRATNRAGAHDATAGYAREALDEPRTAHLDRMWKNRNRSEYDIGFFDVRELRADLEHARAIVAAVERQIRQ